MARWIFAILAACACLTACSDTAGPPARVPTDPAAATFVTSDIEHFWQAYDAGGKDGVASAFQGQYLDRASPGLRDFIRSRNITATSLTQMVGAFPRYFAAIRTNTLRLTETSAVLVTIRANFQKIETLYPAAVYPPVTFLIGRFSTGGTTSQSGMLIGTEFYASDAATPLDELQAFQRNNVQPLDSIPLIIAHEHTHVLQQQAGRLMRKANKTLLDQALLEGSADFVGELVSGSHINQAIYAWALPREDSLWGAFRLAMNGTDVSQWLYNQGSATPDHPGDLGYFIGYRIAHAYYTKASDKTAALRDIIEVSDAQAFLTASGYSGSLSPAAARESPAGPAQYTSTPNRPTRAWSTAARDEGVSAGRRT